MNYGNDGFLYLGYQYSSLSPAAQTHESKSSINYQVQFNIKSIFYFNFQGVSCMEEKD